MSPDTTASVEVTMAAVQAQEAVFTAGWTLTNQHALTGIVLSFQLRSLTPLSSKSQCTAPLLQHDIVDYPRRYHMEGQSGFQGILSCGLSTGVVDTVPCNRILSPAAATYSR